MKIIDQYIEAVGRKLPNKGRTDIKTELRGLLLDEIEVRYGSEPEPDQVKNYLKEFGSPSTVAQRYMGSPSLIAPGLVSFYRLLLKIILGALALAFFITMLLNLISQGVHGQAAADFHQVISLILLEAGRWVLRTLQAWVWSVGMITLILMGVSRWGSKANLDPDRDWNPDELSDIQLDSMTVSPLECIAGLVFISAFILILNLIPDLPGRLEDLFLQTGLDLGHRVNINRYKIYLRLFSLAWIADILRLCILLVRGVKSRLTNIIELGGNTASLIVFIVMVMDTSLYISYVGLNGWRLVFLIIMVINAAEVICQLVKAAWKYYQNRIERSGL